MNENPQEVYEQRHAAFTSQRDAHDRRSRRFGNLNLLLIAAILAVVGLGFWYNVIPLFGLAGVLVAVLLWSYASHRRARDAAQRAGMLATINAEGIARLARDWHALPRPSLPRTGDPDAAIDPSTAADLDLLGSVSLEHLLNTPGTAIGKEALRRWILNPAATETVQARQAAIAELAPSVEERQGVMLQGRLMGQSQGGYDQFIEWAEDVPWLSRRPTLLWTARLLTLLTACLVIAQLAGLTVFPALIVVIVANLVLSYTAGLRANADLDRVAARQNVFGAYAGIFDLIGRASYTSPEMLRLQSTLTRGDSTAGGQLRSLARLMPLVEIRRSMFFFVVQALTLWSLHVLWLLERWQERAGQDVRDWLETLGEAEALIALATLRFDQPDWVFPAPIEGGEAKLTARNLAHPLLPSSIAVGNDIEVGPPGSFLFVTGSNMSGKSTLLRAVGVNTVLAQMGGPVCAAEMQLPPLVVASSMRVQDSLDQGVSYFMAELRRLKSIVDRADETEARRVQPLLYLLDEILQGTNTSERRVAARQVILHLLQSGAIGAVSTHDLTLADSPDLAAASVPVHLAESFTDGAGGPAMTFDYTLRPGIATSTNALKLMALVGLPLENGVSSALAGDGHMPSGMGVKREA